MTNPAYEATNSDERDAFEISFPLPKHAIRCGSGYACTDYNAWDAQKFVERWEGWKACALAKTPAPNGMMQLSNELAEMKRKCVDLQEQKDKWAAWAIALGTKADELESRQLCVKSDTPMREAAPLCVKLPDSSSKAFWSGIGKTEQFHPETYKRWVKEAIERAGDIAGIKVEVK